MTDQTNADDKHTHSKLTTHDSHEPALTVEPEGIIKLKYGVGINKFSDEANFSYGSESSVPTVKAVKAYFDKLSALISEKQGFLSTQPLGSIIGWHRDLVGADGYTPDLPPGWVTCDGQVLDDPESPFNGYRLPNLNGESRFLRGSNQSGSLQDDAFQGHYHETSYYVGHHLCASTVPIQNNHGISPVQHIGYDIIHTTKPIPDGQNGNPRIASETRPVNMFVIWIIKVKEVIASNIQPAVLAHMEAPQGTMYVNEKGNVGIGTTEPKNRLEVNGDIVGNSTITTSGSVGIGTESPGAKLTINDRIDTSSYGYGKIHDLSVQSDFPQPDIPIEMHGNMMAMFRSIKPWGGYCDILLNYIDSKPTIAHHKALSIRSGGSPVTYNEYFYVDANGRTWASQMLGAPNDYAEYFESKNGKEIKPGISVVLDGDKIRPAKKGEIPMGIISGNPFIVGGMPLEWPKKYLKDEFGNQIMEEYQGEILKPKKEKVKKERQKMKKITVKDKVTRIKVVKIKGKYCQKETTETVAREIEEPIFKEVDLYDATGKNKIGKHKVPVMETYEEEIDVLDDKGKPVMVGSGKFETKTRPKINPDYDEKQTYITRDQRPEWNCVGLLGQLPLRKGQPVDDSWIKLKDISKDVELWLVR
ncbi:MAG: hypothetical protein GTO45_20000 [Candidatus Aminicenantes bacterium]|nr:hypothetical protein [Candidatus Aminicenantes bacterium]NIM81077.1 hypothetical protein [Candidatus Aminicenantes bacterium]NIN20454.1 hypothetical protein [Candidatus Aminicenantes bacterium]NIN44227.1 hypothetical protein [Candidatus Aminicenantes bacterium]NIN87045.1 hypothetical protein [Candidatus Aminicenantes bacterium]